MENNVHDMQLITQNLLHKIKENNVNDSDIILIKNLIQFHEHQYYVLNNPIIADIEFDSLFKELIKLENQYPNLRTKNSPTQRVSTDFNIGFETVQHLVPMLSLENSYNSEDLIDFDRRLQNLTGKSSLEYTIEPKFDGGSISFIYENDFLVRGTTRGDGVQGDEVTNNIKQIKNVPLVAKFSDLGIQQIEIRGEVIINKINFENYNHQLINKGLVPLSNARNAAASTLRLKKPAEVSQRNLEAIVYHVSYISMIKNKPLPIEMQTHSGAIKYLSELGFRSPFHEIKICKGIEPAIEYCKEFEVLRDGLPYEIDGMVIKLNNIDLQEKVGITSHHPRWAIAYKFKARQAITKLINVNFQVGRTGAVTPVAKLNAIALGGVTVSSISIHNEEYITQKNLMLGDTVLIERAGDVIPQVVKSFIELRTGGELPIVFPTHCPICNHVLFKEEEAAVWRCISLVCPAQAVEKIIHFASKSALDIKGLGEAIVKKFYDLKIIQNIPEIYKINFSEINQIEGFGKKSIDNLIQAIEASKKQPLYKLIYGLGIRFVGETTAKTLAQAIHNLDELSHYSIEDFEKLEDIGPKAAGSLYQFFSEPENIFLLNNLKLAGLNFENTINHTNEGGVLKQLTFLFTGTLPSLTRLQAEEMVEKNGGKILNSFSTKLNFLVVGDDAGSKLEKAKKIATIKILNEEEFLKMIKQ